MACRRSDGWLNNSDPNEVTQDQQWNGTSSNAAPAKQPHRIGRYRIDKVLGKGGFGLVYLAHDDQLNRHVAVKVPHVRLITDPKDAEAYLAEARTVAKLDHPTIVPVYDAGSSDEFPCYVVSKYIEGSDLAARIKEYRFDYRASVELVATVADALHYAHKQGLVHRDVKPSNILIDDRDNPYIVDFGLALQEEDIGTGPRCAGTPGYMSPEQSRGEGHRVDGRSDIFSLGAVFYELLAGRRAFRVGDHRVALDQITAYEPRPMRQYDDQIPKELERICLKAMTKRAADRYTTAQDMADDLRHFLMEDTVIASRNTAIDETAPRAGKATVSTAVSNELTNNEVASNKGAVSSWGNSRMIKIIPKGLRSFDAQDADFFLALLAGPTDRDGLPDSLRFWKTRIEETDPDQTFAVGLIYGPSGCGKSSLVKAGLLPRLSPDVVAIYLEATAEETETRLLGALRKRFPSLDDHLGLREILAAIRRGRVAPAGKKVCIVIDQFEQWLHATGDSSGSELVQALRQCDGGRVQAIVMLRDDFWMAATGLMRDLEIRLVEGKNSAAVDLFPVRHAENVLAAFGRAFGALPDSGDLKREQRDFIRRAVKELAHDGKVICVRIALFADMMKGKAWTPATLKKAGGTTGIGALFLEETFSSSNAPPQHRLHQKAARRVLAALMPESRSGIKRGSRSYQELLDAAGYTHRERDFADLVQILDCEVRLITPSETDGVEGDGDAQAGQKHYQLTHDYLVPALREWLTKKQRESLQGRTELCLAQRSAEWNAAAENRHLPSAWEWIKIQSMTNHCRWSEPQRTMMVRAGRVHGMRGAVLLAIAAILACGGLVVRGRVINASQKQHVDDLVTALLKAELQGVPEIVRSLHEYPELARQNVAEEVGGHGPNSRERLHLSLARLASDPDQVEYVKKRLLVSPPRDAMVLSQMLNSYADGICDEFWKILDTPTEEADPRLLPAASFLAMYDRENERWDAAGRRVVGALVSTNSLHLANWIENLQPVRAWLLNPLGKVFRNASGEYTQTQQDLATDILGQFAASELAFLVELILDASPRQFVGMFELLKQHDLAPDALKNEIKRVLPVSISPRQLEQRLQRRANAAIALYRLDRPDEVWAMLRQSSDSSLRSWLLHRFRPLGATPHAVVERLATETDVSVRRALIVILGEYPVDAALDREPVDTRLLELYELDPDPGTHAAAKWTLARWGMQEAVVKKDRDLAAAGIVPRRDWSTTSQGHTLVLFANPVEFAIGSPIHESDRYERETPHRVRIARRFGLASTEVTVAQFQEFLRQVPTVKHIYNPRTAPDDDCPQTEVTWYEAAAYCRWLSEQEGVPESQMCYPPLDEIRPGMILPVDYLRRSGFRLPTEAEWEYACRAGTVTPWCFGASSALLDAYGHSNRKSQDRTWPVASLRPNSFGLFDMHGNVYEWCQNQDFPYVIHPDGEPGEDVEDAGPIVADASRIVRGGSFVDPAEFLRSAYRTAYQPTNRHPYVGFRVARTLE